MYGTEDNPSYVMLTPFGGFIPWGITETTELPENEGWSCQDWYDILMDIVISSDIILDTGYHEVIMEYPKKCHIIVFIPEGIEIMRGDGSFVSEVPHFPYATLDSGNTTFIHTFTFN